jgi:thioredoxin 1
LQKIQGSQIAEVTSVSDRISVVDFSADWCGPCKMIHPVLEKLSDQMKGKVDFYTVDVDESQQEANTFGIRGVPTMIIFLNGREIDRMVGFRDANSLKSSLEALAAAKLG